MITILTSRLCIKYKINEISGFCNTIFDQDSLVFDTRYFALLIEKSMYFEILIWIHK